MVCGTLRGAALLVHTPACLAARLPACLAQVAHFEAQLATAAAERERLQQRAASLEKDLERLQASQQADSQASALVAELEQAKAAAEKVGAKLAWPLLCAPARLPSPCETSSCLPSPRDSLLSPLPPPPAGEGAGGGAAHPAGVCLGGSPRGAQRRTRAPCAAAAGGPPARSRTCPPASLATLTVCVCVAARLPPVQAADLAHQLTAAAEERERLTLRAMELESQLEAVQQQARADQAKLADKAASLAADLVKAKAAAARVRRAPRRAAAAAIRCRWLSLLC